MAFFIAKTFSRILQPVIHQLDPSIFSASFLAKTRGLLDQAVEDFVKQVNLAP
jgi:hypothetical protein